MSPVAPSGAAGAAADWSGPWADDARRIVHLVRNALDHLDEPAPDPASESPGPPGTGPGRHDDDDPHPPQCRHCPFCQGVAVFQRIGPDLLDQLGDMIAGLATLLPEPPPGAGHGTPTDGTDGTAATAPTGAAPGRPPSTVRIDVTD